VILYSVFHLPAVPTTGKARGCLTTGVGDQSVRGAGDQSVRQLGDQSVCGQVALFPLAVNNPRDSDSDLEKNQVAEIRAASESGPEIMKASYRPWIKLNLAFSGLANTKGFLFVSIPLDGLELAC